MRVRFNGNSYSKKKTCAKMFLFKIVCTSKSDPSCKSLYKKFYLSSKSIFVQFCPFVQLQICKYPQANLTATCKFKNISAKFDQFLNRVMYFRVLF